jgi:hypothetical protein
METIFSPKQAVTILGEPAVIREIGSHGWLLVDFTERIAAGKPWPNGWVDPKDVTAVA